MMDISMANSHQSPSTSSRSSKQLACTSCRRKKVKCQPDASAGQCRLCARTGSTCVVPPVDERKLSNSRKLTRELYSRISALEAELQEHRLFCRGLANAAVDHPIIDDAALSPDQSVTGSTSSEVSSNDADNMMIIRLCGGQRQLNSNRYGRLRFFGPTSSLHLSESVVSSVLTQQTGGARGAMQWQDTFPAELQDYLLNLYWKYQHHVLPIIHKEAFLHDMKTGQTKYCSKLLVYCILTRAASISNQAEIRALALADDDTNEDPPFLVSKCAMLLEAELDDPGITTLQALQLLSEIYCVISNDTKGWLDAGGACRLAFELGLHSDIKSPNAEKLSQVDLEIRQIAFWSCFSLDRQWALYLGRPQMIKLDDVTAQRLDDTPAEASCEMKMSAAWATLLEIVGVICDALNGAQTTKHKVTAIDKDLRDWNTSLDPSFHYHKEQTPAVFLLHMQYSAATILLHRPLAHFGASPLSTFPDSVNTLRGLSRRVCVTHAYLIAQYLHQYESSHGSALTLSWIALHMIATASTTLIANLAEHRDEPDAGQQLSCLKMCIQSLCELEKSHVPTQRLRKVIQQAIRILGLDGGVQGATWPNIEDHVGQPMLDWTAALGVADLPETGGFGTTMTIADMPELLCLDEFLPAGSQADMLQEFQAYLV